MTLQDWAAIAEMVSAVGVVATLVYLAVQVRHGRESLDANTRALRAQAISDVTRNVHEQMSMLQQGQDVAATLMDFASKDSLGPREALLIDAFLTSMFVARQNEFFQWRQGLLDESVFKSLHHTIFTVLASPNGQHWWDHEGRSLLAPEFVEFVNELVSEGGSASLESWRKAIHLSPQTEGQ